MPERVPSEASAAPGAVVVVTNHKKAKAITALVSFGLVLIVAFQNCAVEISEETPGASTACDPTTGQLLAFETALTTILQNNTTLATGGKTACGTCHLTNSGNSASARFGILPATDVASQSTNFCSAIAVSDDVLGGYLRTSHPGGSYNDDEVQALIDWARTL